MTTKITIWNEKESNGDVAVRAFSTWMPPTKSLLHPGEPRQVGITDSSVVHVIEIHPTRKAWVEPAKEGPGTSAGGSYFNE